MRLRTLSATLLMTALLSGLPPSRVSAQGPARGGVQAPRPETIVDRQSAVETRGRLHEMLREFPPALTQVLRLDPSLLSSTDYLASYPGLAAFLNQHPEIARNPSFFLGEVRFAEGGDSARRDTIAAMEEVAVGIAFFIFFM